MQSYWNNDIAFSNISMIMEYFKLVANISTTSWNVYIVLFYFLSGLLYFVCLDILIISMLLLRSELKKQERISSVFSGIYSIYSETQQILFLPVLEYFLFIFKCNQTLDGSQYVHSAFSDEVCFQGIHIVHVFIAIVNIGIYVLLGYYNEKYIFDYRSRHSAKSK